MITTMTEIKASPFTAKINFRANALYQGKHAVWTFPSNLYAPSHATPEQHFKTIEELVLKTYLGTFEIASVFDNRPQHEIKYDVFFEKKNPLVLQVYHNNVYIDKRRQLDLTWLTPTFNEQYLNDLGQQFKEAKECLDLDATCLQKALRDYKLNLNL